MAIRCVETMRYTKKVYSRIQNYLKSDRDFVVLIGGYEGAGKSTLAIHLGRIACPNFRINKDILYTLDDLEQRLKTVPKYHTLILDEAVEIAFGRNAMKKEQKRIIQMFMQIRQKNICFIMLIPNIKDIDKYFREHRASRWIEVIKRGTFKSHEKIKNIYDGKIFWRQCYVDDFEALDMEDWNEYIEVKREAFKRIVNQEKERSKPKPKPKQWKHKCPKCGYEWKGKKYPRRCPECSKRLLK